MKKNSTKFKGLIIYKKKLNRDRRGYLTELQNERFIKFRTALTYISLSKKNTLRGLHFQTKLQQKKIISVIKGEILDVCVDLRKKSKTFGKYFFLRLSAKNNISLLIPEGFAHGFCVLSNYAIMHYQCSKKRYRKYEKSLSWDDEDLNIKWPKKKYILSDRDKSGFSFKEFKNKIKTL